MFLNKQQLSVIDFLVRATLRERCANSYFLYMMLAYRKKGLKSLLQTFNYMINNVFHVSA